MNCVVICCDTFRADALDRADIRTPNLDRLVQEGIVFDQAFAEGMPTIQARRTMLTGIRSFPWRFEMGSRGLTPAANGWHRVPDEQTMLSEWLLERGVITGMVADTYHMFKPTQNFMRGFSSWNFIRGQEGDPVRSGPLSAVDLSPYLPDGRNDPWRWPALTQYLLNMLYRHQEEDYLTPQVFRGACTWLEENRENAPWFLWIDSFAPHERWDPPMEFADAYFKTANSRNYIQPQVINDTDPSHEEIERTSALYKGYVTFVDKWIGMFLDKLEQMGRLEDTAVVFTSDHGTEIWDKGRFGKGADRLFAYNTRAPLVVRLPGGEHGGVRRNDIAQHTDLFPTVANLMQARVTPDELPLDGRDLLDEGATEPEYAIIAWGVNVSVRNRRWNFVIKSDEKDSTPVLYDLHADPDETTDVQADHPEIVREIHSYLETKLGPLPYEIRHRGDKRQAPPLICSWRKRRNKKENP